MSQSDERTADVSARVHLGAVQVVRDCLHPRHAAGLCSCLYTLFLWSVPFVGPSCGLSLLFLVLAVHYVF